MKYLVYGNKFTENVEEYKEHYDLSTHSWILDFLDDEEQYYPEESKTEEWYSTIFYRVEEKE